VDAKIRRIKELYRSVKNGLPWKLSSVMVKDLVAYSVARVNIRRLTVINKNVCPKVLFTGVKVNYKKELELAFGDYCEVYDGTDNTSASRSIPCIALYPNNNSTGSWEFMNLQTKQRVRRSNWKLMATTELVVDVMIFFEEKRHPDVPAEAQPTVAPEGVEAPEEAAAGAEVMPLEVAQDAEPSNIERLLPRKKKPNQMKEFRISWKLQMTMIQTRKTKTKRMVQNPTEELRRVQNSAQERK